MKEKIRFVIRLIVTVIFGFAAMMFFALSTTTFPIGATKPFSDSLTISPEQREVYEGFGTGPVAQGRITGTIHASSAYNSSNVPSNIESYEFLIGFSLTYEDVAMTNHSLPLGSIRVRMSPLENKSHYVGNGLSPLYIDEFLPSVSRVWLNASFSVTHTTVKLSYTLRLFYTPYEHELYRTFFAATLSAFIASLVLLIEYGFGFLLGNRRKVAPLFQHQKRRYYLRLIHMYSHRPSRRGFAARRWRSRIRKLCHPSGRSHHKRVNEHSRRT